LHELRFIKHHWKYLFPKDNSKEIAFCEQKHKAGDDSVAEAGHESDGKEGRKNNLQMQRFCQMDAHAAEQTQILCSRVFMSSDNYNFPTLASNLEVMIEQTTFNALEEISGATMSISSNVFACKSLVIALLNNFIEITKNTYINNRKTKTVIQFWEENPEKFLETIKIKKGLTLAQFLPSLLRELLKDMNRTNWNSTKAHIKRNNKQLPKTLCYLLSKRRYKHPIVFK